ncbi:hypothetical protein L0U85_18865 [Glycomyces sp. L485]|uniref:carbonic anhydrase n=1 Tax=Glycomyces sp. L485 TaxID=2909235 RepID=UPI001F4B99E1|nr:carbonic anhydrase [Glycomyces sp. L485]MCH7232898.1 hypothetical protein [Glycomyces sp. L485]
MTKISRKASRRGLIGGIGAIGLGSLVACSSDGDPVPSDAVTTADGGANSSESTPASASEAWDRLMEGNARWAAGESEHPGGGVALREELAGGQAPWAIVFGCVDSRVSPQYVFDTGNGDLMTVRTAGSTFDPLVAESVAYGPYALETPLVVVLGHQHCGAVTHTAHALGHTDEPDDFDQITAALTPSYETVEGTTDSEDELVEAMIRANVLYTVEQLAQAPEFEGPLANGLEIVGAYYSLDTGEVERL